jgi:hypothetical protein
MALLSALPHFESPNRLSPSLAPLSYGFAPDCQGLSDPGQQMHETRLVLLICVSVVLVFLLVNSRIDLFVNLHLLVARKSFAKKSMDEIVDQAMRPWRDRDEFITGFAFSEFADYRFSQNSKTWEIIHDLDKATLTDRNILPFFRQI